MTTVSEPIQTHTDDIEMASAKTELAQLVRTHQAGIWRYLRFLGAQGPEADDLTQETFLATLRKPFEHRGEAQTSGYLRTVARNQLLMLRRRQNRQVKTVELETAETVWGQLAGSNGSLDGYLAALDGCLEKLDGRARQALDLQYQEKASRAEIATQLKLKPDGVKTLLRRTRQLLRECVERAIQK